MLLFRLIHESLSFALNSLIVNKLRTFLSLLGITIGIFAIISVYTVIDSLERNIHENISSLGDDVLYIQKWPWTPPPGEEEYPWWKYLNRPVPKIQEYKEIEKRSGTASSVVFSLEARKTIHYKNNSIDNILIWAVTENLEKLRSFEIEKGRYFSMFEMNHGNNLAVIGSEIEEGLFNGINPVGKYLKVFGRNLKIIGVFKREGEDNFMTNMDNVVLIPVNFARNVINIRSENINPSIIVKAKDNIRISELIDEMHGLMRSVRKLKPLEEDNFALNRSDMIANVLESIFSTIYVAGFVIGLFSILVGGFGIANIMFVSVKERTNIIGIQKSLGAKKYFILLQFLFESVILTLIGGILGLILIFAGTLIANEFIDFTFTLSSGNIILGLIISVVIGVISGFAPAYSASRLNPVEAINSSF